MKDNKLTLMIYVLLAITLMVFFTTNSYAQEKKEITAAERQKVFEEIAGDWEFDMMGEIMVVNFYIEDEKLYGIPEMEAESAEIVPVEGTLYEFTADTGGGNIFELTFKKDEEGKMTLCDMAGQGMEMTGTKIDG